MTTKHVILAKAARVEILAEIRQAKYGDLTKIAEKFGLTKARIYYYRKLAGTRFTHDDRATWLQTAAQIAPRIQHRIPKVEGVQLPARYFDFTPPEMEALRTLGYRLNIAWPLRRAKLIVDAKAGYVPAFLTLYREYSKLRLPLLEAQLPPEKRAQLPWLNPENGQ